MAPKKSIVLACVIACLPACTGSGSTSPPEAEPKTGRYRIVHVPSSGETIQIDTATGTTWRLVRSTASGSHENIGWHPIADLTIESRTPYYRSRSGLSPQQFQEERP